MINVLNLKVPGVTVHQSLTIFFFALHHVHFIVKYLNVKVTAFSHGEQEKS